MALAGLGSDWWTLGLAASEVDPGPGASRAGNRGAPKAQTRGVRHHTNFFHSLPMGHVMTPAFHKLLSKVTHWTHNVLGDGTQEDDHILEDH